MKKIILIVALSLLSIVPFVGYGVSFDAFTEIQDTGKLTFSPTFNFPTTFDSASVEMWFAYGIMDNFDVQVNASTLSFDFASSQFNWAGIYVLPRYDLGAASVLEYNIVGLGFGYDGGFYLDVHYHTGISIVKDLLSLEINVIGSVIPSLSVSGIFAPALSLTDWLSVYLQVDPSFSFDSSAFGVEGKIGVDIGVMENLGVNIVYSTSQEIGVMLSITF